jgi:hypothetical protein
MELQFMSPAQHKELQELTIIFSQGQASTKQVQQLSELLAQINKVFEKSLNPEKLINNPR